MIILDTHVWIWHSSESPELSESARLAIDRADALGICAISCWETAMLVAKRRMGLTMDVEKWLEAALDLPRIRLLPIDARIAALPTRLPGDFHGDPADRLIAAACLAYQAPLVTKDPRIREWGQIRTIW
ncbi:type II toxin-antitoxin system VapC family toxin [bacterium]|nr:type II toxin-antitoxin system VapC family toxin [bacterium]